MKKPSKDELYKKAAEAEKRTEERRRKNAEHVKKCEQKKKESGLKKVSVWTSLSGAELRELVAAHEKKILKKRPAAPADPA